MVPAIINLRRPAAAAGGRDARLVSLLVAEDFERAVGPPFITGYPALPVALFPDDGSRWTQIQDSHLVGKNDAGIATARGGHALFLFARGEAPDIASKMDVGKGSGLRFGVGEIVRVRASFFVDADSGPFVSNTLMDIEDGDDVRINGGFATAGPSRGCRGGDLLGDVASRPCHRQLHRADADRAELCAVPGAPHGLIPPTRVVQHGDGAPEDVLDLQEIEKPAVEDDEVRVRVRAACVPVDDAGLTIPDPTAPKRRWAVEWRDLGAYEDLLVERLIGGR